MALTNRLQRRVYQNDQIWKKSLVQICIFERYMTIYKYYNLISQKLTGYHFVIIILAAKEYTGVTESGSGTLCLLFSAWSYKFKIRTSSCNKVWKMSFIEWRSLNFDFRWSGWGKAITKSQVPYRSSIQYKTYRKVSAVVICTSVPGYTCTKFSIAFYPSCTVVPGYM